MIKLAAILTTTVFLAGSVPVAAQSARGLTALRSTTTAQQQARHDSYWLSRDLTQLYTKVSAIKVR